MFGGWRSQKPALIPKILYFDVSECSKFKFTKKMDEICLEYTDVSNAVVWCDYHLVRVSGVPFQHCKEVSSTLVYCVRLLYSLNRPNKFHLLTLYHFIMSIYSHTTHMGLFWNYSGNTTKDQFNSTCILILGRFKTILYIIICICDKGLE